MNIRVIAFVLFFVGLLVSPYIVEPAYYAFLVAFAMLIGLQLQWNGAPRRITLSISVFSFAFVCLMATSAVVTVNHHPDVRDLLRDLGAMFAFFVGRTMFVAYRSRGLQFHCLSALSAVGVIVSIVTLAAAGLALATGASAYVWRGEFVPVAHGWLPYAIVANVALAKMGADHSSRYVRRAILCVIGTLASLSRTDVLLECFFGLALVYEHRQRLFLHLMGFARFVAILGLFAILTPVMLSLDVVQQRMSRGIGANDESLGWRFMEHLALLDHFLKASVAEWLFGFGVGARVPLPPGVLDFNNNTSIPHLHNSFGTLMLKFGLVGLVFLGWYLLRLTRNSLRLRSLPGREYRQAGRWIVLLCLGKALTLQGLSEWSHLVFFGVGCMLMESRPTRTFVFSSVSQGSSLGAKVGVG